MEARVEGPRRVPPIAQVMSFEEHPEWVASQNHQAQEWLPPQWASQWQETLRVLQLPQVNWENPELRGPVPWEDPKAFLASFEQVAEACQWPKEEWVARLLPAFRGEAEQAINELEGRDREDYGKVKAAILQGDTVKMEEQRLRFRQFRCQPSEDPQWVYSQLQELCHQWLKPQRHTKEEILELLALEQFLAIMPQEFQNLIEEGRPKVILVENFMSNQQEQELLRRVARISSGAQEVPSGSAQRQVHREATQNSNSDSTVPPSRVMIPHGSDSVCCPDEVEMAEGGPTEAAMTLDKEEGTVLNPTQSAMYWEVLPKHYGNISSPGGLVIPKPAVVTEPGQEEIVFILVAEDGETSPDSPSAGSMTWNEAKNEISLQESPELREQPEALPRECQPTTSSRPENCETWPKSTLHQRTWQEKDQDKPSQCGGNVEVKEVSASPQRKKNHKGLECGLRSHSLSDLVGHKRLHLEERPYQCSKCGKAFSGISALYGHKRIHSTKLGPRSKNQPFPCASPVDNRRTLRGDKNSTKSREGTSQQESNEPKEGCHMPAKISPSKTAATHKEECKSEGPQQEKMQTESIKLSEGHISMEEATTHTWVKRLLYSQSGKTCPISNLGLVNRETPHRGRKLYTCLMCGKTFIQKNSLEDHQSIHTGEKLHKCSLCGGKFRWRKWVVEHQKIHTEEKPFTCPECEKNFCWKTRLRSYQEAHARQNPDESPM
ncbi:zinc finger protein 213-like isoform X3 [Hemicordylus capensis]|uniref:zinc finger protein 213-like isoform X3 n=1 Tax=Hemicordylus capensis TaxID=884348 RepID=UPI0023035134|nr:zinc finger protein 213-like isoform X3 [Hemicordylus capensis]